MVSRSQTAMASRTVLVGDDMLTLLSTLMIRLLDTNVTNISRGMR